MELTRLLQLNGYVVHAVASGTELVETLASWILAETTEPPTELIVTDVRMPGVNGLSIVEGLRATGWTRPIVVISAFADDDMTRRLDRLEGVSFLPKPFDPAVLEDLIDQLSPIRDRVPIG